MSHRIDEINEIGGLDPYRAAWDRLLGDTEEASFFHSLEWLEAYWRHFGAGQRLRVLVRAAPDGPLGILPLVVRTELTRAGPVRTLTYPLNDWGSFYGPIGPDPAATIRAGLEHVRRDNRDWDAVELRWAGPADAERGCTRQAMQAAGFKPYQTLWDRTAVIDTAGGPAAWERYLAGRTAKWRHNLRSDEQRLVESGAVEYVRYRPRGHRHADADPRWDLYDACEQVARRSWQGDSTSGTTLSHGPVRGFLRDAHAAAARAGALDLNLLLLGGQPAAFAYNYSWQGRVYGLRMGFDAHVAREGAGNVLLARAVRDSFARGDTLYDLGAGYLETKRHLLTRLVPIYRFSYFHPAAPRTLPLRLKRWFQQRKLAARPGLDGTAPPG